MTFDVIIIGKGPAGISAALYVARSGLKAAVIGLEHSALHRAKTIENYYGIPSVSGEELFESGLRQAEHFGVEIRSEQVVDLTKEELFRVQTTESSYQSRALILALGQSRHSSKISRADEMEGRGVSYCAVCDGFFYRGKEVAVVGGGEYALHEAAHLANLASKVTLLTNGEGEETVKDKGFPVLTQKIASIQGEERVSGVQLGDGEVLPVEGVFLAEGFASGQDLARKLGLNTENGFLVVDENQMTNFPGVFAAGDCTGGFLQISTAVGEGAVAGQRCASMLKKNLF